MTEPAMGRNYKIWINGTPLYLAERGGAEKLGLRPSKTILVGHYTGSKKWLFPYLNLPESTTHYEAIVLETGDLPRLWADFQSLFKIVEAAGGFVLNAKNELLVIHRRGSWDLPKGKIDPGEQPDEAALREVREETGLQNLTLGEPLMTSFHTYLMKEKRVLKPTFWYRMTTADSALIPQTEEDIDEARWVEPHSFLAEKPVIYGSILEVIQAGIRV